MSTVAIDTARTNERLSAFKSEIGANDPVDQHFKRRPLFEALMKNKKMTDGGRQIIVPINQGQNQTIKDFSDYDVFDMSAQDTALTLVYPFVNKGGSIVISWEEMRETAGNDHRIFDLVAHRRKNAIETIMDAYDVDLFASSAVATKVTNLPSAVLATGSVGGLSQSTSSDWASTVVASGSFAAQGMKDLRTCYNTIVDNNATPDLLVSTRTEYDFFENAIDPDVRYSITGNSAPVAVRGFPSVLFKGMPWIHDPNATSGVIYMLCTENIYFVVDEQGNFEIDDFRTPVNQKVSAALIVARMNLVIDRRKSLGKLTGVVA